MALIEADKCIIHVPRRFVAEEWGGTETVLLEISRDQQRNGWRPEIYTTMALATTREDTFSGIPVKRFNYRYPYLGLSTAATAALDKKGGSMISLGLFFALWRRKKVRLFHAHTMGRIGGEVRTVARLRKRPYVVSLHGGMFDAPASEKAALKRPTEGKLDWGKSLGALLGSRRVLEDADYIICVGQSEADEARKHIPHDRISYLPNGVDPEKFAKGNGDKFRKKHDIPGTSLLIMNISRIDAQKNQLALLGAFARLHARRADSFLLLMGPETQPDYAETLRKFIRENNLQKAVKLAPGVRTDDPELVDAYAACDIFALPSVHEPFGIVVLEAWSASRPVVAACVGGLQKLIRHGETGLFFDPLADTAVEKLTEMLEQLASQPFLRREMGRAGLKEVRAHYDWPTIGRQLETIYQAAERHVALRRMKAELK